MLELCKEILTKVSFDRLLFQKELKKALSWLQKEEIAGFKEWCVSQFGKMYPDVLNVAFKSA